MSSYFLGGFSAYLMRAVRPPVEPLRMLLDPGMVGRALDREVERDLEPVGVRRLDQAVEVVERAELGMERVVAALGAADRIGAAGIVRPRRQRVVAALAVLRCRSGGSA